MSCFAGGAAASVAGGAVADLFFYALNVVQNIYIRAFARAIYVGQFNLREPRTPRQADLFINFAAFSTANFLEVFRFPLSG